MSSLKDLLSKPIDEVKAPEALPKGHYVGTITTYSFGESTNKKTPFLRLQIRVLEATDDVEGDTSDIDFTTKELRKDYYVTPGALFRLKKMLDSVLGPSSGKTFDERIPDLRNQRVIFGVTIRENENDPDEKFNEVTTVVAAE